MARNAWAGAGQPAWPAAMEAWSSVGGLTLEIEGKTLRFDASIAARFPDASDPVLGLWGDAVITVDADGMILVDGQLWAPGIDEAIRRWGGLDTEPGG